MPDDATYAVPTLDDFAAWYALQLVAPAGAQGGVDIPGITDAYNWLKGNVLDPTGSTISNLLTEIGKTVFSALNTVLGWVLKQLYGLTRSILIGMVHPAEQYQFPPVSQVSGFPPWAYFTMTFNLVFRAVDNAVWNVGKWVWDQAKAGLGFAARGFATMYDVVEGRLGSWTGWLHGLILTALGFAGHGFATMYDAVEGRLGAWTGWLHGLILTAINAIPGIPGTLLSSITSVVNSAASWLWNLIQGAISGIPGIPGTLLSSITGIVSASASWLWNLIQAAIASVPGIPGTLLSSITSAVNGAASWLWGLIEPKLIAIASALVAGATTVFDGLGDILKNAFNWIFQHMFEPFAELFAQKLTIPGRALSGEYETFGAFLEDLLDPPMNLFEGIQYAAWCLFVGFIGIPLMFLPAFQPVMQEWQMSIARQVAPTQPPVTVLLNLLRRGLISEQEAVVALEKMGYAGAWITAILATAEVLPSVSDMIRMGVREVFSADAGASLGLQQDLPPGLVEWAKKIGLSEEWAARFWGAHWNLPPLEMVMEMLHRGVNMPISVDEYLKVADYSPVWRDAITAISYRPINRVDIRRMFQAGVVDRQKVQDTYEAQGYSAADAAALADWVAKTYPPGGEDAVNRQKDLTEGAIKQAYARRLITRDAALEQLMELGYNEAESDFVLSIWDYDFFMDPSLRSDLNPKQLTRSVIEDAYASGLVEKNAAAAQLEEIGFTPEDAALLLELVDLKRHRETADIEANIAIERYRAGQIDAAQLAGELRDLEIPEARIELILSRVTLQRQVKTARLTQAQLRSAFKRGLLSEEQYRTRLDAAGYTDEDIEILIVLGAAA